MRVLFFLIFTLFVISCGTKKEPADCSRFKKGRFLLKDKVNRINYIVDRDDSVQVELNENTDTIVVMGIKWVSECEYELRHRYRARYSANNMLSEPIITDNIDTLPLQVKITGSGKNYYVFDAKTDRFGFIYSDTMWQYNKAGGFKAIGEIFTGE
ncbi:MAG TPA: hypothetical protein VIZ28_19555 [Chitinophagaceae bacterium]